MKKFGYIWGLVCLLTLTQFSCNVGNLNIAGNSSGKAINSSKSAAAFVDKSEEFVREAMALTFGPSVNGWIAKGPLVASSDGPIMPEGYIEVYTPNGGGKIAGSEDGIAFFFREVDVNKNFILEAEFLVQEFGARRNADTAIGGTAEDTVLESNGQEGWGIMARDFVPQETNTIQSQKENPLPLGYRGNSGYSAGNRGGDSNMIMVGGVKRGVRVYWREGIKWDRSTPLRYFDEQTGNYSTDNSKQAIPSGNPSANAYMDAGNCRFSYIPREFGDYSIYTASNGEQALPARPDFPNWGTTYTLKLEKTNNGFDYSIRSPKPAFAIGGDETNLSYEYTTYGRNGNNRIPLYDILDSINKEKYYVGFFSARGARVWVKIDSIKYLEADADDCDPYIPSSPERVRPTLEVVSPEFYTGNEYLYVKSNVDGELVITQDGVRIPSEVIFKEWVVEKENGVGVPHTMFMVPTLPHKDGANVFSMMFYPNKKLPAELGESGYAGKVLDSPTALKRTFTVTKKLYQVGTGDISVSPEGRRGNDGSPGSPLDLQTAIDCVQPGQAIIMENGTYLMKKFVTIPRYNDGQFGREKTLKARDRNRVFIDFNKDPNLAEASQGFLLGGNYWKLDGFHVRNTPNKTKGMVVSGSNNTLSYLMVYNNGDTGMQLSGSASDPKRYWPSNNTIEYCESFNNYDGAETDADGFAAKLTVGKDNKFFWCISHNNNDDGWDLFTKKESGATGIVYFYGCVSYENRIMLNGRLTNAGGNGYKLGGEGIPIRHELRQSLSFRNSKGAPVHSNSNPAVDVYYSTAISSDGFAPGEIRITSGDSNAAYGKRENCVYAGNGTVTATDIDAYLFRIDEIYDGMIGLSARNLDNNGNWETYSITDKPKFLKRKPDGRPDLGNVYRPAGAEGATGAWAFYIATKPSNEEIISGFANF